MRKCLSAGLFFMLFASSLYAKTIVCPKEVYFNGIQLVVEDKTDVWDTYEYQDGLKIGSYYFSYAEGDVKTGAARCHYNITASFPPRIAIKIETKGITPDLNAYWVARSENIWICYADLNLCRFQSI